MSLSAFSVIDRIFGVLLRDTLLPLVEAFARLFGPPLLEFAVLVIQAARRVEGVLYIERLQDEQMPGCRKTYGQLVGSDRPERAIVHVCWPNGRIIFRETTTEGSHIPSPAEERRAHDSSWEDDLYVPVKRLNY